MPRTLRNQPQHVALGAYFIRLRERKGWTIRQADNLALGKKLATITEGVIEGLEKGQTRHIRPVVFRELQELYQEPYENMVQWYVEAEYGISIQINQGTSVELRVDSPESTSAFSGDPLDAAFAQIRALTADVDRYRAALAEIQSFASALTRVALDTQTRAATDPAPKRRAVSRKTSR